MKQTGKLDYLEMPAIGRDARQRQGFLQRALSAGPSPTTARPMPPSSEGLDGGFQADAAEASAKPLPVLYSEELEATLAAVEMRRRATS